LFKVVAETGLAAGLDSVSVAKKAAADPLGSATAAAAAAAARPSELLQFCPPLVWDSSGAPLPPQPPPEWLVDTSAAAAASARGPGGSGGGSSGDPMDPLGLGALDPLRAGLGDAEVFLASLATSVTFDFVSFKMPTTLTGHIFSSMHTFFSVGAHVSILALRVSRCCHTA
jgi:hypothetical protein